MKCKKCHIDMENGIAMVPVWGNYRNNFSRGSTIYPISAVLKIVKKCTSCGYSVSFNGRITGEIHECRLGKYVEVIDNPYED